MNFCRCCARAQGASAMLFEARPLPNVRDRAWDQKPKIQVRSTRHRSSSAAAQPHTRPAGSHRSAFSSPARSVSSPPLTSTSARSVFSNFSSPPPTPGARTTPASTVRKSGRPINRQQEPAAGVGLNAHHTELAMLAARVSELEASVAELQKRLDGDDDETVTVGGLSTTAEEEEQNQQAGHDGVSVPERVGRQEGRRQLSWRAVERVVLMSAVVAMVSVCCYKRRPQA